MTVDAVDAGCLPNTRDTAAARNIGGIPAYPNWLSTIKLVGGHPTVLEHVRFSFFTWLSCGGPVHETMTRHFYAQYP